MILRVVQAGIRTALSLGLLISVGAARAQAVEAVPEPARDDLMRSLLADPVLNIAQLERRLATSTGAPFDSRLRLAELYVDYGMPLAAEQALQRVIFQGGDQRVADQAWFMLAKLRYEREDLAGAEQAMRQVRLLDSGHPEQPLLAAALRMARNDYNGAATILGNADDGKSPIITYNRGIALLRSGQDRPGEQALLQLVRRTTSNRQDAAVLDRAHLALGHYYLAQGQLEQAAEQFQQVHSGSPYKQEAMLGAGLVQLTKPGLPAQGEASQRIWQQLIKGNPSDFATLEAMLAIPASYVRQGDYTQAVQAYEKALGLIQLEQERVTQIGQTIGQRGVLDSLKSSDYAPRSSGWMRPPPELKLSPEAYYLQGLLASHGFQETLKNYRDLEDLEQGLNGMRERLTRAAPDAAPTAAIAPLQARISTLAAQTAALRARHQQTLNAMASEELARRQRYLANLVAQANLGIAQVYDRMSRGGPR